MTLLGPGQPGSRLHFHNQHGECLASAGSAITHSARRDPPGAPPPGPPRISRCSPGSVPCLPPTVPAMTTFEQALRLHAASGRPFDRARTELLYGESLRRRRKRLQAREHLRAANELFERLSADPWAERARTELRASGETPRRRDPGRAQQLTPPEHLVARIVAAGTTSEEAAARLFLSPRTIHAHLRSIYAKLGISSRSELQAADLDHLGPIPARG